MKWKKKQKKFVQSKASRLMMKRKKAVKPSNAINQAFLPIIDSAEVSISAASPAPACTDKEKDEEAFKDLPGFIFFCSGETKLDCFRFRVFGLRSFKKEILEKLKPGAKLFLFDVELKLLYGVYEATSAGQINLEPSAFGGKYPAQVKFQIFKECLPLRETSFRHAIKDNYRGRKFKPELNGRQVMNLLSLFSPLAASATAAAVPHPLAKMGMSLAHVGVPNTNPAFSKAHQISTCNGFSFPCSACWTYAVLRFYIRNQLGLYICIGGTFANNLRMLIHKVLLHKSLLKERNSYNILIFCTLFCQCIVDELVEGKIFLLALFQGKNLSSLFYRFIGEAASTSSSGRADGIAVLFKQLFEVDDPVDSLHLPLDTK